MTTVLLAGVEISDVSQKDVSSLEGLAACANEFTVFISTRGLLVALQTSLGLEGCGTHRACKLLC